MFTSGIYAHSLKNHNIKKAHRDYIKKYNNMLQ